MSCPYCRRARATLVAFVFAVLIVGAACLLGLA